MKLKGITFSPAMLPAVMDGRKTQTRRLISPQPGYAPKGGWEGGYVWANRHSAISVAALNRYLDTRNERCYPRGIPYQPGQLLYVREAYRTHVWFDFLKPSEFAENAPVWYEFGGPVIEQSDAGRYRHARFMPQRFARTWIKVAEVRAERLGEISAKDAIAEGVRVLPLQDEDDPSAWFELAPGVMQSRTPQAVFVKIWQNLYGPDAWDRDQDKWVWVVTFERTERPKGEQS